MDFSEIKELKFIFPQKKFYYFLTKLKAELWLMPGNVNSQKFPHGNLRSSMATSGPRRGPTFNNRWWNDRREWNLRIGTGREGASPKGANHTQSCSCSPPLGTIGECVSAIRRFHDLWSFHPRLFTFAPFGDGECLIDFLPQKRYIILPYLFFSFFLKENPRNFRKFQ